MGRFFVVFLLPSAVPCRAWGAPRARGPVFRSCQNLPNALRRPGPPRDPHHGRQLPGPRLRRRLGPDTGIEADPTGYRIAFSPEAVDAHRFERLSRDGTAALARVPRLEELRLSALQDRLDADLALGGGPALVPELWELLAGAGPAADGRALLVLAVARSLRRAGGHGPGAARGRGRRAARGSRGGVRPVRDQRALG
ncbi:AfsR/SARP family transcriptional regulator [Streptomyces mirabilis]|uniref:AfsR/SARP family transcriptional regulator n=1 Tax=Streptomyces mirabilis TaxID=68239 RepID=UPI0031BA9318